MLIYTDGTDRKNVPYFCCGRIFQLILIAEKRIVLLGGLNYRAQNVKSDIMIQGVSLIL